jgi:hypothetical protein
MVPSKSRNTDAEAKSMPQSCHPDGTAATKTVQMAFEIADYVSRVAPVERDDLDYGAFELQPLSRGALRCLRYMHDVENHTVCYLRDLLVTQAHRDPEITTFLTFWNFEEYWHGDAIGRVLTAHGESAGPARVAPMRGALGWRDRIAPMTTWLASLAVRELVAVHMTWGAINEWSTQAGYARLIARAQHPVLTELLRRIMRQEGRHIDFYSSQAARRLESSAAARRITRLALRHFWTPVGAGVMPEAEARHLITYLFGDDDGRAVAARIDRHIDRLPGLAGLGLATGAIDRYAA